MFLLDLSASLTFQKQTKAESFSQKDQTGLVSSQLAGVLYQMVTTKDLFSSLVRPPLNERAVYVLRQILFYLNLKRFDQTERRPSRFLLPVVSVDLLSFFQSELNSV